jgi:hypothetical protein
MTDQLSADVDYIVGAAPRLATIASLAAMSFGLADGANEALKRASDDDDYADHWREAALGFQDGTLMMAVIRVCILLDSDSKTISFQAVYRRMVRPEVQRALIDRVYGDHEGFQALFGAAPAEMVEAFLSIYRSIDWDVHARLIHFRNFGVAHLLERKNWKSITYDEMRALVLLVARLGDKLTELCRSSTPPIEPLVENWREFGSRALEKLEHPPTSNRH